MIDCNHNMVGRFEGPVPAHVHDQE